MQRLQGLVQAGAGGAAKRCAQYNMESLKTFSLSADAWDPSNNLYVKQAESKHDMWERLAHLVLAPDLALKSHKRMCPGGKEAERKKFFDVVFPRMEEAGWAVKDPFLRFWEGERSKDKLLKGLKDKNDIGLVSYVYDKYFAPLMTRKVGDPDVSHGDTAEAFFQEHKVMLTRIVQLTSEATYNNGRMRFTGNGLKGERETVKKKWFSELEDAGFNITSKILQLWDNERNREVLLRNLNEVEKALMLILLRLLQIEEGTVSGGDQEDLCRETVILTLDDETRMIAYFAQMTVDSDADVGKKRERAEFLLDVSRFFSSCAGQRQMMHDVIGKIYAGERLKDALPVELKGVERAFVKRVLYHLENTKFQDLQESVRKNQIVKGQALKEHASHRFFKQKKDVFKRLAQLCDGECAKKFEDDRQFPGDLEKERSILLREVVKPWTKFNYHLVEAIELLWQGERNMDALCLEIEPSDFGSRYCVLQTLKLCHNLYGVEVSSGIKTSPETMPILEKAKSFREEIYIGDNTSAKAQGAEGAFKFQVRTIVLGKPDVAAAGIKEFIGLDDQIIFSLVMEDPLKSMRREWFENGSANDKANFIYVVSGTAGKDLPDHVVQSLADGKYHGGELKEGEFDQGHEGMTLSDFVNLPECKQANLKLFHAAAIRLYSSDSYQLFTEPLRNQTRPHPIKTTMYVLDEAIRKLRSVRAKGNTGDFTQTSVLWRGLKDATLDFEEFKKHGGTEFACMSTSRSRQVAIDYAMHGRRTQTSLVFKIEARGLSLGVDISFMSLYPKEVETLYPPLTYMMPNGETYQEGDLTIVPITAQI